jgi:DeoR/GlpR family transcriptional regulator of sugar metabolism
VSLWYNAEYEQKRTHKEAAAIATQTRTQSDSPNPRQQALLARLDRRGSARTTELSAAFSVDPMTVRRDLQWLEARGLVERFHGGARLTRRGVFDRAFAQRARTHEAAKAVIGEYAAGLVRPGQIVLIDTGSTPLAVARALARRDIEGVTVVTPSLPVLWELYDAPQLRVTAIGGDLHRETGRLYGPLTENVLATLVVDLAFVGTEGIDSARGFLSDTPEDARMVAAMGRIARQWYVVADSSKLGAPAPFVYAPLAGARLITNALTTEQRGQLAGIGLIWEEAPAEATSGDSEDDG